MPSTLTEGVLTDDLVPVLDEVRDCLNEDLGLRQWDVQIVTRFWDGSRIGSGGYADEIRQMAPKPRVRDFRSVRGELRRLGIEEEGDIVLTEVSLEQWSEPELYLGTQPGGTVEQHYYCLVERHGQQMRSRYFVPAGPPRADRDRTLGWVIVLRQVDPLPDYTPPPFCRLVDDDGNQYVIGNLEVWEPC